MIHVFREKEFFYLFLFLFSWRVSQFPTRVVIIIIMDHSYNNNNKWRLHAIFSDPRVWINRGSTMDQHGSTWISRLQHAARPDSWLMRPDSCVRLMAHASSVLTHASGVPCVRRPTRQASGVPRPTPHASDSTPHASGVRLHVPRPMRQASGVRRPTPHASGVPRPMRQASGVRRQASGVRRQASGVPRPFSDRRPLSVMTTTKRRHLPMCYPIRFAPIELYGMG